MERLSISWKNINQNIGFTLLEMVIVIALMAILAAIAIARWPGVNLNLNAQAQQLANDIRYTQSLAMTRGQRYRLNLLTATTYSITDLSGNAVGNNVTGNNTVTYGTGITKGTTSNLPNNLIAFDGQGIPYIDATAATALTATASISLTAGSVTRTLQISPETGRVIVQ